MMKAARGHTLFGLCFAILGMALGIYMAKSQNHVQHVTHAHTLLLGLVVSLLYGMVYRLWIADKPSVWPMIQLALHQLGTVGLVVGLFLLYGGIVPVPTLAPVMGLASIAVLLSAVLMLVLFIRSKPAPG